MIRKYKNKKVQILDIIYFKTVVYFMFERWRELNGIIIFRIAFFYIRWTLKWALADVSPLTVS